MVNCFVEKNRNQCSIVCNGIDENIRENEAINMIKIALSSFVECIEQSPEMYQVSEHKNRNGYFALSVQPKHRDLYSCVALNSVFLLACMTIRNIAEKYPDCVRFYPDETVSVILIHRKTVAV